MLTREETAKVFAMYLGCEVLYKNTITYKMLGVECNSKETLIFVTGGYAYQYDNCKLLLTPLSAITDEHAVEVTKMEYPENHHMHTPFYGKNILRSGSIDYPVADKLRSWGYMLPYNGVDLFEAGIAIIKQ